MLTDIKIRKAKPKEKPYKLSDGEGLFLLINSSGSKLWKQKFRFLGKEGLLSHGRYPQMSLKQARQKRDETKALLAEGTDPAMQKKLDAMNHELFQRTTFKLIAEEYLETLVERDLSPATLKKKRWHIFNLSEALHNRPINEITSIEILHILKKIEKSGRRETAKKLRGTLSAIFRHAVVTLRADNDPTYAIRGALLPPKVTNRAAITDEKKFGELLRALDEFSGWPAIAAAMKFQILTMTRPGEVRGAKKQEFDLEARTWTIPKERMKMRREHKIPLANQTFAIVEEFWPELEQVDLIFPSLISNRKWISENAFNSVLRRMGFSKEEVTAHGFRTTASTILNDRRFDGDVIEAALAHQDKNAIRRTYNRSTYWDQRVQMMQDWADLVDEFRTSN